MHLNKNMTKFSKGNCNLTNLQVLIDQYLIFFLSSVLNILFVSQEEEGDINIFFVTQNRRSFANKDDLMMRYYF